MMSDAVRELCVRLTAALERRPEVLEAYLFGSWSRDRAQPHSDVDVGVFLEPPAQVHAMAAAADIGADLMAALGRNGVDVVVLNAAPPVLHHRVLRDGIRLVSRDLAATTTREGRVLSRYCDHVPQLAKIDAAFSRRLELGAFGR